MVYPLDYVLGLGGARCPAYGEWVPNRGCASYLRIIIFRVAE